MATGLEVPWGIAFLPGGDALVSERTTGRILRLPAGGGAPEVAMEVPGVDTGAGEGGLLGLAVSPDYEEDELVYAYFTTAEDNRIARFRLGEEPEPILTGLARAELHNGGRIAFGPDGKLYATVGDTGDGELAQDPESENGKILRMEPDGGVPADNPTSGSRVWSLGHRNVQGLAWDDAGRLWATEFGEQDADEVNLIRPGANYGWPEVEGEGDTQGGRFTNPLVTWEPTGESSPSGAAVVGDSLYVAALQGEVLWRVPLQDATAGDPVALLRGRVRPAPDGRAGAGRRAVGGDLEHRRPRRAARRRRPDRAPGPRGRLTRHDRPVSGSTARGRGGDRGRTSLGPSLHIAQGLGERVGLDVVAVRLGGVVGAVLEAADRPAREGGKRIRARHRVAAGGLVDHALSCTLSPFGVGSAAGSASALRTCRRMRAARCACIQGGRSNVSVRRRTSSSMIACSPGVTCFIVRDLSGCSVVALTITPPAGLVTRTR